MIIIFKSQQTGLNVFLIFYSSDLLNGRKLPGTNPVVCLSQTAKTDFTVSYENTIEWNSCLCISQLVRKPASECKVSYDSLPLEQLWAKCLGQGYNGVSVVVLGSFDHHIWTLTSESSLPRLWSIILASCKDSLYYHIVKHSRVEFLPSHTPTGSEHRVITFKSSFTRIWSIYLVPFIDIDLIITVQCHSFHIPQLVRTPGSEHGVNHDMVPLEQDKGYEH